MKAYAYVVGPQDMAWQSLFDTASNLGLAGISDFRGLAQVEHQALETPVCFFLFSAVEDVAQLRPLAEAIRFSSSPLIRFSPMIYCAEQPSVETTMACISMGFDDIIALPQTGNALGERMARQIDRNLVFYETQFYFGPDRRNRIARRAPYRPARAGGPFRRVEIVRNLLAGVSVLQDETFAASAPVAAMQTLQ